MSALNKFPESFRDYLTFESFDTKYEILKVQYGNPSFYYFKIQDKEYRIFVEKLQDIECIQVGFEYFNGKSFSHLGKDKELSTEEVLALFGTVLDVIKQQDFQEVFVQTDDFGKYSLYKKIANKMAKELNLNILSDYDGFTGSLLLSKKESPLKPNYNNTFKHQKVQYKQGRWIDKL